MKQLYTLTILTILLLSDYPAQSAEESIPIPSIPASSPLYGAKISIQDIQEWLTFNTQQRLLLKQQHLDERLAELKYESIANYNRNSEKIIQKIQIKRLEIEQDLEKLKPECVDSTSNTVIRCDFKDANDTASILYKSVSRHNTEVLTKLLASPTMPEASKKGLTNALNRSGIKITANQVQSATYNTDTSLIPFRRANFYDPTQKKWFSIIVNSNAIRINNGALSNPEYTIYPTSAQIAEIESMANKVNKQGRLTTKDKIALSWLWFAIEKK